MRKLFQPSLISLQNALLASVVVTVSSSNILIKRLSESMAMNPSGVSMYSVLGICHSILMMRTTPQTSCWFVCPYSHHTFWPNMVQARSWVRA